MRHGPVNACPVRARIAGAALTALLAALVLAPVSAGAAAPPQVEALWATEVAAKSARLHADLILDPTLQTFYRFNYITEANYAANLAAGKEGFAGAKVQPPAEVAVDAGPSTIAATALLSGLSPETTYRYRIVARNIAGTAPSPVNSFTTQALGGAFTLPDGRGWEMVSPVDKNGGQVDAPGADAGGGVLQAALDGGSATFSSSAAFAGGAGAPPASQYVSRRGAAGWTTENVTASLFSGSYGTESEGAPYRLFSSGLERGLLLGGRRCRSAPAGCAVANPPPGSGAPTGYEDYYLREAGGFKALISSEDILATRLAPGRFEVDLAGATPDLSHVVLASCAALSANAVEAPMGEGCDPAAPNLYEWSGGGLSLLNVLPGETQGTPGAQLAAQSGAISSNGNRVYFTRSGNLYLRDGSTSHLVGEGAQFQAASENGAVAFYTREVAAGEAHLFRYVAGGASSDLTPTANVAGVLGASAGGDELYYQDGSALKLWQSGTTTTVAPSAAAAAESDFPPAVGSARVSADGAQLAFLSEAPLTGYDNTGPGGEAVSEVFVYDATGHTLTCVSCNPTNERPLGSSSIPGAIANGEGPDATRQYKPRALSAGGRRLFFDSDDALAPADSNNEPDVYEWEAQGEGSCEEARGCVSLVSSGRAEGGARFFDASADGSDVFFRTDGSLVTDDPGSVDLYDARIGGGFPVPTPPLPCVGDACQSLPPEPIDPTLNTLVEGSGNPPVHFYDTNRHRPRYHRLRDHHHLHKRRRR